MIQITQLKLPYQHTVMDLEQKIRKTLKLSANQKFTYKITKKSLDARKKPDLFFSYIIDVKVADENVRPYTKTRACLDFEV